MSGTDAISRAARWVDEHLAVVRGVCTVVVLGSIGAVALVVVRAGRHAKSVASPQRNADVVRLVREIGSPASVTLPVRVDAVGPTGLIHATHNPWYKRAPAAPQFGAKSSPKEGEGALSAGVGAPPSSHADRSGDSGLLLWPLGVDRESPLAAEWVQAHLRAGTSAEIVPLAALATGDPLPADAVLGCAIRATTTDTLRRRWFRHDLGSAVIRAGLARVEAPPLAEGGGVGALASLPIVQSTLDTLTALQDRARRDRLGVWSEQARDHGGVSWFRRWSRRAPWFPSGRQNG